MADRNTLFVVARIAGNRFRGRRLSARAGLSKGAQPMLRWAAIFLVIALIAALFGFTDIASASAGIAQVLFAIFLVLFLGAALFGAFLARRV
jgi:uncharacterized membrane protein YtjA (UPF0391 family)